MFLGPFWSAFDTVSEIATRAEWLVYTSHKYIPLRQLYVFHGNNNNMGRYGDVRAELSCKSMCVLP